MDHKTNFKLNSVVAKFMVAIKVNEFCISVILNSSMINFAYNKLRTRGPEYYSILIIE